MDNQAAVPAPLPPIDSVMLSDLARDLAQNLKPLPDILATYNLSQEQYEQLVKNEYFNKVVETLAAEWRAFGNTPQRLALENALILEHQLPHLAARLRDPEEDLGKVVEGTKLIARLAGVGEKENAGAAAAEKFVIQINLGDAKVVKDVTPVTPAVEVKQGEP